MAKKRAKQGSQRREQEDDAGGNPSTDVYIMFEIPECKAYLARVPVQGTPRTKEKLIKLNRYNV